MPRNTSQDPNPHPHLESNHATTWTTTPPSKGSKATEQTPVARAKSPALLVQEEADQLVIDEARRFLTPVLGMAVAGAAREWLEDPDVQLAMAKAYENELDEAKATEVLEKTEALITKSAAKFVSVDPLGRGQIGVPEPPFPPVNLVRQVLALLPPYFDTLQSRMMIAEAIRLDGQQAYREHNSHQGHGASSNAGNGMNAAYIEATTGVSAQDPNSTGKKRKKHGPTPEEQKGRAEIEEQYRRNAEAILQELIRTHTANIELATQVLTFIRHNAQQEQEQEPRSIGQVLMLPPKAF